MMYHMTSESVLFFTFTAGSSIYKTTKTSNGGIYDGFLLALSITDGAGCYTSWALSVYLSVIVDLIER